MPPSFGSQKALVRVVWLGKKDANSSSALNEAFVGKYRLRVCSSSAAIREMRVIWGGLSRTLTFSAFRIA